MVSLCYSWELQNGIDPSVCFGFGGVFPFRRRSLVALMRKWKGSRGRAVLCIPPFQEFHKASFFPPTPASPRRRLLFSICFFYTVASGRSLGCVWYCSDTALSVWQKSSSPRWGVLRDPWAHSVQGQWWLCRVKSSGEECGLKYVFPKMPEDSFAAARTDSSYIGCGGGLRRRGRADGTELSLLGIRYL